MCKEQYYNALSHICIQKKNCNYIVGVLKEIPIISQCIIFYSNVFFNKMNVYV